MYPGAATKARRMLRPVWVRIGIFWRFGSTLLSLPVEATVWLNVVWMRPSGPTSLGRASV